jgi:hypothetical protein
MPGETLFPAALQGQAEATQSAQAGADLEAKKSEATAQEGIAAMNEKLDQAENMVTITPQIALGMVKNTGDKEWLKAVGTKMRSDVAIAMYTNSIKTEYAKHQPKVTQVYGDDGKIRHAVVYTDPDGNQQQLLLDPGMKPEQLNKGKGGSAKPSNKASDDTFKKNKEFMRAHEKQASLLNDPVKSKELQATNADQYNKMKEEFDKDQDRYDQLKTQMGAAGGSAAPAAGGGQQSDNAPFDADALIKEALSNK